MALFEKIQSLRGKERSRPGGILSIYLDTDRSKPENLNGKWKVILKNGLKKLEEYLGAQRAEEEKIRFSKLANKVEKEINHLQRDHQKSLILFASDDLELWEIEILQVEVKDGFHWEEKVVLGQLESINEQHPPCGIILAQMDEIRVVDTALGQVLDDFKYEWEVETEDWTTYKGTAPSSGRQEVSSSLQTDTFDKRNEVHQSREIKKALPKLQRTAKNRRWKGIYLVGNTAFTDTLKEGLPHLSLFDTITKNLQTSPPHEILDKVIYSS